MALSTAQAMLEPEGDAPDLEIAQLDVGVMLLDNCLQAGNGAGQQLVVGIEKPEVLAPGGFDHGIACGTQSLVVAMPHQAQAAGPALFQRVHDGGRAIGGTVVQQQDFNAGIGVSLLYD